MVDYILSVERESIFNKVCVLVPELVVSLGLGASNWRVTPGMRLATVFEALVRATPSTVS